MYELFGIGNWELGIRIGIGVTDFTEDREGRKRADFRLTTSDRGLRMYNFELMGNV